MIEAIQDGLPRFVLLGLVKAARSPDGTEFAYASKQGDYDIYAQAIADPNTVEAVTNTGSEDELNPAWSPDGTRLAVSAYAPSYWQGTPPPNAHFRFKVYERGGGGQAMMALSAMESSMQSSGGSWSLIFWRSLLLDRIYNLLRWAAAQAQTPPTPAPTPTATPIILTLYVSCASDAIMSNSEKVNVRSLPDSESQLLDQLSPGTELNLIGRQEVNGIFWDNVTHTGGEMGWISETNGAGGEAFLVTTKDCPPDYKPDPLQVAQNGLASGSIEQPDSMPPKFPSAELFDMNVDDITTTFFQSDLMFQVLSLPETQQEMLGCGLNGLKDTSANISYVNLNSCGQAITHRRLVEHQNIFMRSNGTVIDYNGIILNIAQEFQVPPRLLKMLVMQESKFIPDPIYQGVDGDGNLIDSAMGVIQVFPSKAYDLINNYRVELSQRFGIAFNEELYQSAIAAGGPGSNNYQPAAQLLSPFIDGCSDPGACFQTIDRAEIERSIRLGAFVLVDFYGLYSKRILNAGKNPGTGEYVDIYSVYGQYYGCNPENPDDVRYVPCLNTAQSTSIIDYAYTLNPSQTMIVDWELGIASYNGGQNAMANAIYRMAITGGAVFNWATIAAFNDWEITEDGPMIWVQDETRKYVCNIVDGTPGRSAPCNYQPRV